jgi:hypothetical protein
VGEWRYGSLELWENGTKKSRKWEPWKMRSVGD